MTTIAIRNLFLLLFIGGSMKAQMANTGEMAVLPGTTVSTFLDFDNTSTASFTNDGEFHVYGSLNNDGIIGFTAGQRSYTIFSGIGLQSISGSAPSDYFKFYDVLFDNSSLQPAFQLTGNISISGNSDFLQGILKGNQDGLVVYENRATHSNTDNDSHADAYVQKNGDEEFHFGGMIITVIFGLFKSILKLIFSVKSIKNFIFICRIPNKSVFIDKRRTGNKVSIVYISDFNFFQRKLLPKCLH